MENKIRKNGNSSIEEAYEHWKKKKWKNPMWKAVEKSIKIPQTTEKK